MIKKMLWVVCMTLLSWNTLFAQFNEGDWTIHPVFYQGQTNIVDSESGVYFVADQNLYKYDKATQAISALTKCNKLNDSEVVNIYNNRAGGYLLVAYASSNIDMINADGSVVNISDIADVQITSSKTINDVSFAGDDAYIATDFGFLVLDGASCKIVESNVLYTAVNSAIRVGDKVWVNAGEKLYWAAADASHANIAAFTLVSDITGMATLMPINATSFLFRGKNELAMVSFVADDDTVTKSTLIGNYVQQLEATGTGFTAVTQGDSRIYRLNNLGRVSQMVLLEGDFKKSFYSATLDETAYWELSKNGVRKVAVESDKIVATAAEYVRPMSSIVKYMGHLIYNKGLDELWAMPNGKGIMHDIQPVYGYLNTLKNGVWTNMTPADVPTDHPVSYREGNVLYDPLSPIIDPDDPNTYYVGTWFEGVYKITGNKVVAHYTDQNSPMVWAGKWCVLTPAIQMDADRNLWVFNWATDGMHVLVLPRDKQDKVDLTADDWIKVNVALPSSSDYRQIALFSKKSNIKVFLDGRFYSTIAIFDDGGNPASSSIRSRIFEEFIDQDNNKFDATNFYCLFEDSEGMMWLGTSDGVIRFDPTKAFDDDFRVHRMMVEDGSSSNYLLIGNTVTGFAEDNAGNKWISTRTSGIYEVNSDGTKILRHFNSSNSLLTTDRIESIACKPDGSAVYAGTESGLIEFNAGVAPAESDFSRVSVSPMNIRPEYTGFVSIEHLVSGSTIAIVNAKGETVATLNADGGVAQWNLCNDEGVRVPTGKYMIKAVAPAHDGVLGTVNVVR